MHFYSLNCLHEDCSNLVGFHVRSVEFTDFIIQIYHDPLAKQDVLLCHSHSLLPKEFKKATCEQAIDPVIQKAGG